MKDWLGLSPSREDLAAKLIQLASKRGMPGWRYGPNEVALTIASSAADAGDRESRQVG